MTLTPARKRLLYALFAVAAFVFALRQTLPVDAVRQRLVMEAAAQGVTLSVADVAPAGLVGVRMEGLTIEPRDGVKIPVDRLDVTLRVWPLLLGRRGVAFDARLLEGRARGTYELRGTGPSLEAHLAGLDLSRSAALRAATGLALTGVVGGDVDLALDEKAPARSAGRVDLTVDRAALNGGQVPVPGMASGLTVPRIDLGRVTARGAVKEGRLAFDELAAKGPDLEASSDGLYVLLGPRLALAPIFGKARLKVSDAFWSRPGNAPLKSIAQLALAPAKAPDGGYAFQIFGTVSAPQARMGPGT